MKTSGAGGLFQATVVFYMAIVILIIISFQNITKEYSPEGKFNNKNYGVLSEDISVLLSRIEWANSYPGKINTATRFFFYSLIVSFIALLISLNKIPTPLIYIQVVLAIWICMKIFSRYTYHHCDKFSSYGIQRNIRLLRKKLGLKKAEISALHKDYKFPSVSSCWNYIGN